MKEIYYMSTTEIPIQIGGGLNVEIRRDLYPSLMVRKSTKIFFIPLILRLLFFTSVEEQTQEIELPLHDAARRGNVSFLREYLKQGISGTGLDAAGNTPLYWAARTGHLECASELLNLPNPVINAQVREWTCMYNSSSMLNVVV